MDPSDDGTSTDVPVYLDPTAPLDVRVAAILELMTDEQKLDCLSGLPAITLRDGYRLPGLTDDGVEGTHGSGHHPNATMFPQAIGLGATWNVDLLEAVGGVVGRETRSRNRGALRVWGPVQDVRSNPLAGRYEESYGEDPFLCGRLGTAYAFGIKGRHRLYLLAKPEMKHFFAYNHEWNRIRSSSSMGCRAMHEFHLVSYRMPVVAGAVLGAMTAYNLVNGIPMIVHPILRTLRDEWAPDSFMFVPDYKDQAQLSRAKGAVHDTWEQEADVPYGADLVSDPTDEEAIGAAVGALLLLAGMTNYRDDDGFDAATAARRALRDGVLGVSMTHLDQVVSDWLAYLIRTGGLDRHNPYNTNVTPHCTDPQRIASSRALALSAAREQLVLLKNDRGLLPLDPARLTKLAVIGPLADANLRDYYSPLTPDGARVTPLQGVESAIGADKVDFSPGVDSVAWRSVVHRTFVTAPMQEGGSLTTKPSCSDDGQPTQAQVFQLYDWGYGQHFIRSVATGRYVSVAGAADEVEQAARLTTSLTTMVDGNSWITTTNFHYLHHEDGTRSLRYVNFVSDEPTLEPAWDVQVGPRPGDPLALLPSRNGLQDCGAAPPSAARFEEVRVECGAERVSAVVKAAEYAVVVVGNHVLVNGRETQDRPGLGLSAQQRELVRVTAAAQPGRTIVVIVSSYPLAVKDIQDDSNVAAILYTSHAGQSMGTALAEALFGGYSPAGRLTATWLVDESSLPVAGPTGASRDPRHTVDMLEYDVLAARLTYRYSAAEYVYPFGYGLTYPSFSYRDLSVPARVVANERFSVVLRIENTGDRVSDEVVQVYLHSIESAYEDEVPLKQLVGFCRVPSVRPGETRPVHIEVDPRDAFVWDVVTQSRVVEAGQYDLMVGASSADIRLAARIVVDGQTVGVLDLTTPRNAWEYATSSRGVTYWRVSKQRALERRGGYHSVVSRRPGDYVGFTKVNMDRVGGIALRIATSTADWACPTHSSIVVHIDSPSGPVLGEVGFPGSSGRYDFRIVRAHLRRATDVHRLFLVFRDGGVYLDTVQLLPDASR